MPRCSREGFRVVDYTVPYGKLIRIADNPMKRGINIVRAAGYVMVALMAMTGWARADQIPTQLPPAKDMLFWTPDQQAIAYRNFANIYASRLVQHGADVLALPKGAPLAVGTAQTTAEFLKANHTFGLLILHQGRIRLETYNSGLKPTDHWVSYSMSKSVTSTLIGAAIKDGKISSVDELVTKYVPELKGSGYDGVTIRQVLNMSTGVKWNENYLDRDSDTNFIVRSLAERHSGSLLEHQKGLPRAWAPDSKFDYNSGNTHILGVIISRATGKHLADYLSEKIWKPAGMESDATWVTDGETGQEFAGCCLNATLRDFGRFGLFALHEGKRGSYSAVPAGWFAEATAGSPAFKGYSFQWWLQPEKHRFAAAGVFGQNIIISPNDDTVIVMLSARPKPVDDADRGIVDRYVDAVLEAVRKSP